jgi:hypothetical protein
VLLLVMFLPGGFAHIGFLLRDRIAQQVTRLDPNPDVVPPSLDEVAGRIQ